MIEIKNLCKSYENKKVYDHFNLKIKEQAVSCVIGPSGFGKTTLLRLLAGLEDYEAGEIIGTSGKRMSFVFQEDRLMPWLSVADNICYVMENLPHEEKEKKLEWVLKLMKLTAERKSSLQSLSGGMSRRVAIARAIVYESDILLLDEPFKGLDDALKWEITEQLLAYWQEKQQTVLLVTHEQEMVQRLGNVIDLEKLME